MKEVLVPVARGFEEIELVTIADVLRRAGLGVTLASLEEGPVTGGHDITLVPDTSLDRVQPDAFAALVLPGGGAGSKRLREDERVIALVRRFVAEGKVTAAVCAAPTVLEAAGVLADRRATSYPGSELPSAVYSEERVVEDGMIVTSRGPGTALEFALALVRRLAGADVAQRLATEMLARVD